MDEHTHEPASSTRFPSGRSMNVCECGATQEVDQAGRAEPWHTCRFCTHTYGLPAREAR